jgi:hypothetical protein
VGPVGQAPGQGVVHRHSGSRLSVGLCAHQTRYLWRWNVGPTWQLHHLYRVAPDHRESHPNRLRLLRWIYVKLNNPPSGDLGGCYNRRIRLLRNRAGSRPYKYRRREQRASCSASKQMRGERERERCAAMGDSCMTVSSPRWSVAWGSPGRVGASGVIDMAWEALTLWRFHAGVAQPRESATWRRELPCRDNPW